MKSEHDGGLDSVALGELDPDLLAFVQLARKLHGSILDPEILELLWDIPRRSRRKVLRALKRLPSPQLEDLERILDTL